MKLQVKNAITINRLVIIAALVGIEAFVQPLHAILSQGVWPEPVQVATCVTTAILQVVTITLGLLERKKEPS